MATVLVNAEQQAKENTNLTALDNSTTKARGGLSADVVIKRNKSDGNSEPHQESTRWLIVAPYPEREHLLDLDSLDMPNRLFAIALSELEPATGQYSTVKYEEALDWNSLMSTLEMLAARGGYRWTRHDFYVVEFRSRLKETIDADLLFTLDKESHIEATQSGGLLKYWYGVPNANRRNLATCKYDNSRYHRTTLIYSRPLEK